MKNKSIKYLGYIVTIIAFIFIGKSIMSMNLDIRYIKNPVQAVVIIICLSIGYVAVVFISSYAWKTTLQFINKGRISLKEITGVYVKSNIGKYLPGNVMHFAGRNILAGKLGFKQLDITFCTIIEIIMLIFTDFILSFIFAMKNFKTVLIFLYSKINPSIVYGVATALILLIILVSWILIKKSRFVENYRHLFTKDFLKLLLKLFCIYSVTLIISGVFLVMILKLIFGYNITVHMFMITISAYTISWVSGYIVPGAPGGIGVRESVLLLMLEPLYTKDIALLASILLRITSILGDLIAFLLEPLIIKIL